MLVMTHPREMLNASVTQLLSGLVFMAEWGEPNVNTIMISRERKNSYVCNLLMCNTSHTCMQRRECWISTPSRVPVTSIKLSFNVSSLELHWIEYLARHMAFIYLLLNMAIIEYPIILQIPVYSCLVQVNPFLKAGPLLYVWITNAISFIYLDI